MRLWITLFMFILLPLLGADGVTSEPHAPTPEEMSADTSRFMGEFFKMLLILGAMVLVLYFVSWYIKKLNVTRFEKGNDQSLIKIVERRSIAPRVNIYVLDIEGRTLVVGESPQGVSRLAEYPTEGKV